MVSTIVMAPFLTTSAADPLRLAGGPAGADRLGHRRHQLVQPDLSQQHPPAVGGTAGAVKQVSERIGTAIGNAMITAVLFSLASNSWVVGFTAAYGVIVLILLIALGFAIMDLRMLGDGGSRPVPSV